MARWHGTPASPRRRSATTSRSAYFRNRTGCTVSGGYRPDVLGKLAFIGAAQSAGFKLREIKKLVQSMDGEDGMAGQIRSLSSLKLNEVEALLERTKAMKGWLEVAKDCGCETSDQCALFPSPGEESADHALTVVHVKGGDCRRASA